RSHGSSLPVVEMMAAGRGRRRPTTNRRIGTRPTLYRGAMPGESYFLSFGGLGLSLAGFAGLIAALNPASEATRAVIAYRIRTIVILGFSLTFVGFGTVALYAVTNADLSATVRIATLLMLLACVRGPLIETRH